MPYVLVVPLAQLPVGVVSPALQDAAVENRAREGGARLDGYRSPPRAQVHRWEVVAHLVIAHGVGVADAELAVSVVSPALHAAFVKEGARVVLPGRNLGSRPSRA